MADVINKRLFLAQRIDALRNLMRDRQVDGYFLTHLSDIFYFTDYRSEGYFAFIGLDDAWLFLPNLLYQQGKDNTFGFTCLKGRLFETLDKVLKVNRFQRIGFDPNQLSYAFGLQLAKRKLTPIPGLVTELRKMKDELELDRLKKANHMAALGAEFVRKRLKPGKTEKQIAADLAHFFSTRADGIAFDLIIAAGPHSAYPHHINSETKLKLGDAVICDIGATWQGYRSDLTRTFTLGRLPALFHKVFSIVEKAQKEGILRVKPGVTAGSVDLASRRVIRRYGYGPTFVHSTGHGVGIDIHEDPRLGPGTKDVLKAGMVVTVEPGIYLPGKFGVRIEDTLLVTPTGSEILTK